MGLANQGASNRMGLREETPRVRGFSASPRERLRADGARKQGQQAASDAEVALHDSQQRRGTLSLTVTRKWPPGA